MDTKTTQNTEPIQQLLQSLGTTAVFGEPITQNGTTVIPVAHVAVGFGYGSGYGRGGEMSATTPAETDATGEGGGSGGGGGGRSKPCGFIRITGDDVKYAPIADETRIPLAGIVMVAWVVFWVMATIRVIAKGVAKTQQLKWKLAQAEVAHDVHRGAHKGGKAK